MPCVAVNSATARLFSFSGATKKLSLEGKIAFCFWDLQLSFNDEIVLGGGEDGHFISRLYNDVDAVAA
jgi:hypothetical protein